MNKQELIDVLKSASMTVLNEETFLEAEAGRLCFDNPHDDSEYFVEWRNDEAWLHLSAHSVIVEFNGLAVAFDSLGKRVLRVMNHGSISAVIGLDDE